MSVQLGTRFAGITSAVEDPITFAVASDFHFPQHDPEVVNSFANFVQFLHKNRVASERVFVILNGDVVDPGGLDAFSKFLERICLPQVTCIWVQGNHEEETPFEERRLVADRHGVHIFTKRFHLTADLAFEHGDLHGPGFISKYPEPPSTAGVTVYGHAHQFASTQGRVCLGAMCLPDGQDTFEQGFAAGMVANGGWALTFMPFVPSASA